MKYRILPFLLAVILGASLMTACGSGNGTDGDEAVNRVYPEGEGHLYNGEEATGITVAHATNNTKATKASTSATQTTTKPKSAVASTGTTTSITPASPSATAAPAATQPTVRSSGVPADSISGDNVNPNIGSIQNGVQSEINSLAVQSISLSAASLTLETGESRRLEISFNPANATNKTCTLSTDNQNASATLSGSTITVTGNKAGICTLTVTSQNGHKATCDITIKRSQSDITDDTVLSHAELVNAANAERWTEELAAYLESLGMNRRSTLQGESFRLSTADLNNVSFNDVSGNFAIQAENQAAAVTDEDWDSYEFNCICKPLNNGEYAIVVAINTAA